MSLSRLKRVARRVEAATRRLWPGIRPFVRVFRVCYLCIVSTDIDDPLNYTNNAKSYWCRFVLIRESGLTFV